MTTRVLAGIGTGFLVLKGVRMGMEAFGPARDYRVQDAAGIAPESEEFLSRLACVVDALPHRNTGVEVLTNGNQFYPAELEAIDGAQDTVNLEAYEFLAGDVTREFVRRLAARAAAGVQVRMTIDASGSGNTPDKFFDPLRKAGGRVVRYHPLSWRDWPYYDHRTHRKLLIVDGRTGFAGGAGFGDHWMEGKKGQPRWRDTMLKITGASAQSLNATFAQNWVCCTGEILFTQGDFPDGQPAGDSACMVVMSMPGYGTSRARILFQCLIEAARKEIAITTPYFLPDRSARGALIRAAQRGVQVRVLTAGKWSDHPMVRRLSEGVSARLIRHGVEFHEYEPSMIHAKLMTVDGVWTVAGSTNFDHRSFALNDEVNVVIQDEKVTRGIDRQFEEDLRHSKRMSVREIERESLSAGILEKASWLIRREE